MSLESEVPKEKWNYWWYMGRN